MIYPHVSLDGDAVGSSVALCKALRIAGKEAYVLIEDNVPLNLRFMEKDYFTKDLDIIASVDISICVDCGDLGRFPARKDKFLQGRTTICIDHHQTNEELCDYNYVDSKASATGELIFELLMSMGTAPDTEIGEAIFAAITTDTGNFQYSNTTKRCFEIMAELLNWGTDTNKVSVEIYENERPEKKLIESRALSTLEIIGGGKGAIAYITQKMLNETGALSEETDQIVQQLRSIAGVEYAAFLKEKDSDLVRVSLRAKREGNVADIATKLGGGGHIKAAGCTLHMSIDDAVQTVKKELIKNINKL